MSRRTLVLAGLAGLAALLVVGAFLAAGRVPVLAHAYLVAWLVLVSLPLGALPVLMALELARRADHPLAAPLRLLLAALPVLAVLMVPILIDLRDLYPWVPGSGVARPAPGTEGFGADWFTPLFFRARAVGYLVAWLALGVPFLRPASGRVRPFAGPGLAAHLVVGTLAGIDWFMSLDQAFTSSAYGTLVVAAQVAFALAVAFLVLLLRARAADGAAAGPPDRSAVLALLVALAVAAFLQFTQYLVIWSANLPKEVAWYQARAQGGLGLALVAAIPVLVALAVAVLLPPTLAARPLPALLAAAALVLAAVADLVWLTSPRDTLTGPLVLLDLAALVVVAGAAAAGAVLLGGVGRTRHG